MSIIQILLFALGMFVGNIIFVPLTQKDKTWKDGLCIGLLASGIYIIVALSFLHD